MQFGNPQAAEVESIAQCAPPPLASKPVGFDSSLQGKIRAVIADDEPVAREILARMLRKEADIEIVGTATNGREAAEAIERLSPDLAFLDMQMPELSGLDVLARLGAARPPAVVFMTASQGYALQAFEAHALDYILKPCSGARFRAALQRARECIQNGRESRARREVRAVAEACCAEVSPARRFAVRSGERIVFPALSEIHWLAAVDGGVEVHLERETHRVEGSLTELEPKLNGGHFLRIDEKTLVNLEHVKHLIPSADAGYVVSMRQGAQLRLAAAYQENLSRLSWL